VDTALFLMQTYDKDTILAVLGILGGAVVSFFFYRIGHAACVSAV
jgi:hypothetical protein